MNAPGSDCIVGAPGLSAAADETWEGGAGVPEPTCDGNTGLENIFVNSPGPDLGAAAGGADAMGALETGVALAPGETGLENIRVNSPGLDCAAGAPGLSAAADETGESGAGADETGLVTTGPGAGVGAGTDSLDVLAPIELNIRVNAPGADDPVDAPAGAWGLSAGAPVLSAAADETGEGGAGETGLPTIVTGGFCIATGLKTRATSLVRPISGAPNPAFAAAFDPAFPPAPGIVSACSMRVNSPGLRDASGPAAGDGADSFTGSVATGTGGCAAGAANAGSRGSASAFFSGVGCPSSEASKSSSARGAAGTCPKTPVALDG